MKLKSFAPLTFKEFNLPNFSPVRLHLTTWTHPCERDASDLDFPTIPAKACQSAVLTMGPMPLFALTSLTMLAFAANSLLNRAALAGGGMDPAGFALVRVVGGVGMLFALVLLRQRRACEPVSWCRPNLVGALSLSVYLLCFSYSYTSIDAGLGALILFGVVQITMFAGAIRAGENLPATRWFGAVAALSGLALLLWPGPSFSLSLSAFVLMSLAAIGWGIYSLIGRNVGDPLEATAWNFLYSLPVVMLVFLLDSGPNTWSGSGVWLALISGAMTSGLGYALWYSVLPRLGATIGALVQLSVPVIAILLGLVFLGESLALRTVVSALIVLGGIAIGVLKSTEKQ